MWAKRRVRLVPGKLAYFIPDHEKQIRGIIDFNLVSCVLKVGNNNKFRISILRTTKEFTFRCDTKIERDGWIKEIQNEIWKSKGYNKILTKVVIQPLFWKFDRISQEELMNTASTGDIILFRSHGVLASFHHLITCSKVGIVMEYIHRSYRGCNKIRWK